MPIKTRESMVMDKAEPGGVSKVGISLVFAAGVCCAYLLGVSLNRPRVHPSAPEVSFEPKETKLGEVPWGTTVDVQLSLVNSTGESAKIDKITSSCGCLTVNAERHAGVSLAPGEAKSITVKLNTEKNAGDKVRQVFANLADGRVCTATIVAKVVGTWTLSVDRVEFSPVQLDLPGTQVDDKTIEFRSASDALTKVDPPAVSWLETYVDAQHSTGATIVFRLKPEYLQPGTNSTTIVARTSNSVKPDAAIFVRAIGIRQLNASPERVFLPDAEPRVVRFVDPSGKPVRLKSVLCDSTNVIAEQGEELGLGIVTVRRANVPSSPQRTELTVVDEYGNRATVRLTLLVSKGDFP